MRRDGFALLSQGGLRYYSCRALDTAGFRHGFSTRHGGNLGFRAGDSPERVGRNRRRFLAALGLEDRPLLTLRQVHSSRIHIIGDPPAEWNRPQGDGLAGRGPGVVLGVESADCAPVLLADPAGGAMAAVHSGWRGTLFGVLPEAIRQMQRSFGSDPAGLLVAAGPFIGACCFEVGAEVAERFSSSACTPRGAGKCMLDLERALEEQLDAAGVDPVNRYALGECTRCRTADFFSHRAEGARSGRMLAVIAKAF